MSRAPRRDLVLTGYKTVAQAIKANPKEFNFSSTTNAAPAGWLGVVIGEKNGKPVIDAVAPESPAEAAGLAGGRRGRDARRRSRPATAAAVRDVLRGKLAGDTLTMTWRAAARPIAVTATLEPASKPMSAEHDRAC